jgi:riboflavin kinase/FMN adenylyltransferase
MKIYQNACFSDFQHLGSSVALGNFDGVHRGHAHVISIAKQFVHFRFFGAITFDPHPRDFFHPSRNPFHLTSKSQKEHYLKEERLDFLWHQTFDGPFAEQSPEHFAQEFLVQGLRVGHVVVGPDFAFGHGRSGNVQTLRHLGERLGFGVTVAAPWVDEEGIVCASTTIRRLLRDGNIKKANHLLGRPYTITGPVMAGDRLGRTLGFPTANLSLGSFLPPHAGAYAVTIQWRQHRYYGVANVGLRPTVGGTQERLEVHLFDFQNDLYGDTLHVSFHHFLRPEMKFPSLPALKACIEEDCRRARQCFGDL